MEAEIKGRTDPKQEQWSHCHSNSSRIQWIITKQLLIDLLFGSSKPELFLEVG